MQNYDDPHNLQIRTAFPEWYLTEGHANLVTHYRSRDPDALWQTRCPSLIEDNKTFYKNTKKTTAVRS